MHVLTAEEVQAEGMHRRLGSLAEDLGTKVGSFLRGLRVPWDGGEEFVTLGTDAKPVVIHADVNAAQNLQRRFWTRHGDAYRLAAIAVKQGESDYWYSDSEGARIRGALAALVGGEGRRPPPPIGRCGRIHPREGHEVQWRKVIGGIGVAGEEEGIDELEIELAEAVGEDEFDSHWPAADVLPRSIRLDAVRTGGTRARSFGHGSAAARRRHWGSLAAAY